MAVLKFLGTSASIPSEKRDNTSFLFKHKNNSFLIDCPGSISHKLLKLKEKYQKINRVIVTHHHPDHIYGIISLIHTQMRLNQRLTIFSSGPAIQIIKKLIRMFKLDKPGFPKVNYINVFEKKFFFAKNGLKIKALKNKHIKDSFGIYFAFKKKLFYSSDTAFSKKLLNQVDGVDYLIHDCTASSTSFRKYPQLYRMHTSSLQLVGYLKNKLKTTLIPVHFCLTDKKEIFRIRRELLPLKRKVTFVKDYQKIIL